ncbi:MAG: DciA family protein [Firmicutes bacterium]|nr:DciA family protein [Bacillota bacterium]
METSGRHLGEILLRLSDEHHWTRARWLWLLERSWADVVGDVVSQHTKLLTLTEEGILWIAVPSSVWSSELLFHKPRILARIEERWPSIRVTDLRTRVRTEVRALTQEGEEARPSPYARWERGHPSTEDLDALFRRVQEQYQRATEAWLRQGYRRCLQCRAPTEPGYRFCIHCEIARRDE